MNPPKEDTGMLRRVKIDVAVTDTPIPTTVDEPAGHTVALGAQDGARVVFAGCIRNHDEGNKVQWLHYEAHPEVERFLTQAVTTAVGDTPVSSVYVRHRIGDLGIGDVALLVIVDAPHRNVCFSVCADVVDQIKAQVPIWKEQHFTDGSHSWSRCP